MIWLKVDNFLIGNDQFINGLMMDGSGGGAGGVGHLDVSRPMIKMEMID